MGAALFWSSSESTRRIRVSRYLTSDLNSLQVGLRKYVAKCKLTLQNELIESFKSSALNSPRMRNAGIKIIESEAGVKNRVSKSLENG